MQRSPTLRLAHRAAILSVAQVMACASTVPTLPELPAGAHRILFIGNSLTYTNDLPALVAEIARADGQPLGVASVAAANTALVDHLTQGSATTRIAQGGWDAVVLQQGPTPAGICRDTLVMATIAFDVRIRAVGARTATLMTWPYSGYPDAFSWVHESARVANDAVHGLFLPAGDAWVAAWRLAPSLELYGPDGYHPSVLGSLLTAFVVYQGVTGRDVRQVPTDLRISGASLQPATIRTLQQAAYSAFIVGIKAAGVTSRMTSRQTC